MNLRTSLRATCLAASLATSIQANAATIEFSALELKARYEEPAMSGFGQCTVAFSANGQTGIVAALVYSNDVFMIKLLRSHGVVNKGSRQYHQV